ncbi:monovalent cation/H+ antiporter complex subunit F [Marinospirillum alkaliphilum]|uniref:Multicomponent Na+:H+ antiporter subunit F n=1 Tax=Marinospirillum alkaliphilum DSM 21637 TaxID=1122209 RepID=A0A1K1YF29_9GAMM|nr:monovalent cation/H+ antiporter complex subunit F [Marinospirillum alkaliphilum]SFX59972.1 multicomponent Na+:H+ antiporter subunit F [Marinospirillum alkaliphilum DSM 21637]
MTQVLWISTLLLLLALLLGLWRIWAGPGRADRMLAAQLFGTTGVGLLLLLAELMQQPALRDVALVLALLAIMATVAFVARTQPADHHSEQDHDAD